MVFIKKSTIQSSLKFKKVNLFQGVQNLVSTLAPWTLMRE